MPTLREFEQWLSTGQVSKRLGRSRQGVINLAEDKSIRAVKGLRQDGYTILSQ
jgi:biotin operon repressor